jgi:hypothetical protein
MALHYAKVDGGAKLKALINANPAFMATNGDNFQLAFENVVNRTNPINQFEISRADYYAPGKFFVDMMNAKSDPRRAFFLSAIPYDVAAGATPVYRGSVAGDITTTPYSRVYTYLRGSVTADSKARTAAGGPTSTALTYTGAAPQKLLTFAEYNFIRAEAALVYGATGDAVAFFKAGINASMSDAGVSTASATSYVNAVTPAILDLKTIIEEKYVANFGVPVEPWTDWRRTGFPAISVTPAAAAQGNNDIPRILIYPISEQQTNAANVPARASMAVKGVFWDN